MSDYDLNISSNACSVNCKCSRWDVQNYNIIVETWVKKSELQNIRSSLRPGAVGELYTILGRPRYYDKSWTGANTLMLSPIASNLSNLKNMRDGNTLIFVKNISDVPVNGSSGWLQVKIEGMVSGTGAL